MLVRPGVHRFATCYPEFEHIPMAGFVLVGRDAVAMVDATIPGSVDRDVAPYLASIGLALSDIDWVFITHGHPDHVGGLGRLAAANPALRVAARAADRRWVEDQQAMWDDLFCRFKGDLTFDEAVRAYIVDDLGGQGHAVTDVVAPGDRIELGGLTVSIVDAAGHSPGHIAIYEEASRLLFTGDSVQGAGIPHVDAERQLPPLYEDVDEYQRTITRMRSLDPNGVLSAHHSPALGEAGKSFLDESQRFADRNGELVLDILRTGSQPATTAAIAGQLHARLETLDSTTYLGPLQMMACSVSHLTSFARRGMVREVEAGQWAPV
jgi:glyoxylase-like metal-dependent hydrolase (beta-lactamase superfamily II)